MSRLQLLGAACWHGPDGVLPLARELRFRLLAYVASQPGAADREQVASVFWPEHSAELARRNLRKNWFQLRRLHGLDQILDADAHALRCCATTDLAQWRTALGAGAWRTAIALYGGPFLHGLDGGSQEFQSWLQDERDRIAAAHRDCVLRVIPTLRADEHETALEWLEPLAAIDPYDESVMRHRAACLVASGKPAAALQLQQRYGRLLREDLGLPWSGHAALDVLSALAPGSATPSQAAAAPSVTASAPLGGAPSYVTSFVGRQDELLSIETHLAGGTRLLTLHGPPGCGKTRLAARAFTNLALPGFARRFFVELDRLPPADSGAAGPEFIMHLAAALGIRLADSQHAMHRLAAFVAERPTWLVLDNFEHRMVDLPVLERLLQVPTLALLVTSRTRLACEGEQRLELQGLAFEGGLGSASGSAALQLFEARCGRLLDATAAAGAARLCALLEGQPLAIELAARQCVVRTPAELADLLAEDLDALEPAAAARPAVDDDDAHTHASDATAAQRSRSLRAAFESSWRLLPQPLRQQLSQLAVLRTDFSKATARQVAGSGEAMLAALVDRSLLRVDPASGRLRWHPFVRGFALDKLRTDPAAWLALRERHARHFAHWLRELGLTEEQPEPGALRAARFEIEHLIDAWRHAVALRRHELWEPLAEALALCFEIGARYREGSALLALAENTEGPRRGAAARSQARVAVLRARLLHWAENEGAQRLAAAALSTLQRLRDDAGVVAALRVLGVVAWRRGETALAIRTYRRALARAERSGEQGKRAMLLDGLGLALLQRGDEVSSRCAFLEALELNERSGNSLQRVHNLINLALDARVRSPPQAMALARRALELAEQIDFKHYVPHALTTMALAHVAAGDTACGAELARRAAQLTRQAGDSYIESWSLAALARAALAQRDAASASAAMRRGLQLSWGERDLSLVVQHLALAAHWLLLQGRKPMAERVARGLLAQDALPLWLRAELRSLPLALEPRSELPAAPALLAGLVHEVLGALD